MRLALFHMYREEDNTSMRLYADRLGGALLRRGLEVHRIRISNVLPRSWRRWNVASRADSLYGRFVRLPRAAHEVEADVYHLAEHSQAHLVDALDPDRTVVTCHDLMLIALAAGRIPGPTRHRVATWILRRVVARLNRAAVVVAVSEHTRRDLEQLMDVDPRRIEVVYPGLNEDFRPHPELRNEVRRRLGLGRPTVLHVGQTEFYKNVEGCLRVLARVRGYGIDAQLVRAGELLQPCQRKLAEDLGIASSVVDLGRLSARDLIELYSAADVLLFPSLYEGFGWPPIEAMSSGLPVVCSNAGALPEVTGGAALMSDPTDDDALAKAVAEVVSNPLRASSLREAGLRVAARYSWERCAASLEVIYQKVIRRAPSPPR